MLASLGNFFLYLSLFFSISQFLITQKKNSLKPKFISIAVNGFFVSTLISFFILIYAYIISDFSILNVFQNSHTTKPILYKISATWGNHEGSMLLWMFVLAVFNYFIFKLYNKQNFIFILKTLEIQSLINLGFLTFIIFTSNPFVRLIPAPNDGMGFNPILQDPALAIHPPLLYIGYVGFSATFSFAIAALTLNDKDNIFWYSYMRPFALTAWTFLTIGIAFGSIWAYYELGWGGWWFWDPVENASFMPWLLGTALLHSLIVVNKRKSLQTWTLLLSILTFLLSVIGTFLVRSGILTSVHTFALDPTRGIYILVLIALLGGYSLIIYSLKSKKFFNNDYFFLFSREGSILLNNTIMVVVCATVFLGTIYPLIIEIFSNNKISVGEPYFNSTTIPIILPAILVMGIGPMFSWNKKDNKKIIKKSFPAIICTFIISFIFFWIYTPQNLLGFLGVVLSFWIISNILLPISLQLFLKNKEFVQEYTTKYSTGMTLAHLGIGLLILGITTSSVWQKEKIIRMELSNNTNIHNYNIVFKEINKVEGPNYVALQGKFVVYNKKKKIVAELTPENRFYHVTNNVTTEASIDTNLIRDLYIVLGEGNLKKGWVIRIYYNPLVIWIWIGAFMIFIGGLFSIITNLKIIKLLAS